jgi:hypothetical protein
MRLLSQAFTADVRKRMSPLQRPPVTTCWRSCIRRTNVVGIFPNAAAITRLVGSQLREQQEEWQMERRRFFSEATMAKIPEPAETTELTYGERATEVAGAIS